MSEEEVALVLTDSNRIHKHGSGVGLVNVNSRIQILFGKEYGLLVESEPDEGTSVSICIPAVPYTEENRKNLEMDILQVERNSMKKDKKMFILIEAVLGSLVLVLAFVMLQEKNEKEKQKIAVIIENSDDNQWAGLKYGLKKAAEDRDVELSVASRHLHLRQKNRKSLSDRK